MFWTSGRCLLSFARVFPSDSLSGMEDLLMVVAHEMTCRTTADLILQNAVASQSV